jgi:hypothetical protein
VRVEAAATTPSTELLDGVVLCASTMLFHHDLASEGCSRAWCKFSHEVSNPSKRQLEKIFASIKTQPELVVALKIKTKFADM